MRIIPFPLVAAFGVFLGLFAFIEHIIADDLDRNAEVVWSGECDTFISKLGLVEATCNNGTSPTLDTIKTRAFLVALVRETNPALPKVSCVTRHNGVTGNTVTSCNDE